MSEPARSPVGPSRRPWLVLMLLAQLAGLLADQHARSTDRPLVEQRLALHQQVIERSAPTPYRQRVLAPWLLEAGRRVLTPALGARQAFVWASTLLTGLWLFLFLAGLWRYLSTWYPPTASLAATLAVAGMLPITFWDHVYQPWSWLEAALLPLALLTVVRGRWPWLLALVALAALTRETGLFVALAAVAGALGRRAARERADNALAWSGVAVLIAAGSYYGLRLWLGQGEHIHGLGELWTLNTRPDRLLLAAGQLALLLALPLLLAALGWRRAPRPVRWLAAVVPCWLATLFVFGVWTETRLLLPLWPFLAPLALAAWCSPSESAAGAG